MPYQSEIVSTREFFDLICFVLKYKSKDPLVLKAMGDYDTHDLKSTNTFRNDYYLDDDVKVMLHLYQVIGQLRCAMQLTSSDTYDIESLSYTCLRHDTSLFVHLGLLQDFAKDNTILGFVKHISTQMDGVELIKKSNKYIKDLFERRSVRNLTHASNHFGVFAWGDFTIAKFAATLPSIEELMQWVTHRKEFIYKDICLDSERTITDESMKDITTPEQFARAIALQATLITQKLLAYKDQELHKELKQVATSIEGSKQTGDALVKALLQSALSEAAQNRPGI